jgi:hypothetical protein
MLYINRMFLNEIPELINRKDLRSARKWCKKNGVIIYKGLGEEYVIKNDFDLAYDMPLINELKAQYGDKWQIMYRAYQDDELHKMLDVNPNGQSINTRYIPKGTIAKNNYSNNGRV